MTPDTMTPTVQEIANEIRMLSNINRGPFLLVEGAWDVTFFSIHLTVEMENIIASYGWRNVLKVMSILKADGMSNVLGVIDLDYYPLVSKGDVPGDVIMTDSHDLETMMFFSDAFSRVLKLKSSAAKVKAWGITHSEAQRVIQNKIGELSTQIAVLRLYSQLESLNYSFEDMDVRAFVSKKPLSFSIEEFLAHLRGIHPHNAQLDAAVYAKATQRIKAETISKDPSMLCCGHDLMDIMAIGLRTLWGSHDSKQLPSSEVQSLFVNAYSLVAFEKTLLFQQISEWLAAKGYTEVCC